MWIEISLDLVHENMVCSIFYNMLYCCSLYCNHADYTSSAILGRTHRRAHWAHDQVHSWTSNRIVYRERTDTVASYHLFSETTRRCPFLSQVLLPPWVASIYTVYYWCWCWCCCNWFCLPLPPSPPLPIIQPSHNTTSQPSPKCTTNLPPLIILDDTSITLLKMFLPKATLRIHPLQSLLQFQHSRFIMRITLPPATQTQTSCFHQGGYLLTKNKLESRTFSRSSLKMKYKLHMQRESGLILKRKKLTKFSTWRRSRSRGRGGLIPDSKKITLLSKSVRGSSLKLTLRKVCRIVKGVDSGELIYWLHGLYNSNLLNSY